jgi:hypothetical protein
MTIQQFEEHDRYDTIQLDKSELLQAYIELDKIFHRELKYISELNQVYSHIEKATGYGFKRILEKNRI